MYKRLITTMLMLATLGFSLVQSDAAKKNDPDDGEVEEILKKIGGEHFIEDMKVRNYCSLEFENEETEEEVYYHFYVGTLRKGGYHLIVFNNKPEYLGFYKTDYEPSEYNETEILLNSGESDEDGNSYYYNIAFSIKGPAEKIRIDGTPVSFVKNPNLEKEKSTESSGEEMVLVVPEKKTSSTGEVIDYRDWKITMGGQERIVNAIFEKVDDGKVYIKSSKNGAVAGIPGSALSLEDQEYVKRVMEK